jgi:hypothetical protein
MAPLQAKPLGPARCGFLGPDSRGSHVLCAKFAPMARRYGSENKRNLKKEPPALSKPLRIVRPLIMMWACKRIRVRSCEKGKPVARRGRKV